MILRLNITIFSIVIVLFATSLFPITVSASTIWTKFINNPVINKGLPGEWDEAYVYPGDVLKEGSIYKMWYTGTDNSGKEQVGYATSNDGINWIKYNDNPVLKIGTTTDWDSFLASQATVLFDGTNYLMWYSGNNGSVAFENWKIGLASSVDGINWVKYSQNPVLSKSLSGWDNKAVYQPKVLKINNNDFRMWYSAVSINSTQPRWKIGYASSSDGINWTKYAGNPVLTVNQSWESNGGDGLGSPSVIYDGSKFQMWYHVSGVGYAESNDGINWTKDPANPVVPRGSLGEWDNFYLTDPNVIKDGNDYKMWYTGWSSYTNVSVGLATTAQIPSPTPTFTPTPSYTPTPTNTPFPSPTPTLLPNSPIIVVPGFGASINKEDLFSCKISNSNNWQPLEKYKKLVYDPLLNTLINNAHLELDKDVYFYSYDWRQTPDILADHFKQYLDEIDNNHPGGTKFKMVGHSLGGIVLRSFVQKFPQDSRVLKILTAGTPHKGAVFTYPIWEKGDLKSIENQGEKLSLNLVILVCQFKSNFYPFLFNFREIDPISVNFNKSRREVVQSTAPVIQSVLPVFDYLRKNGILINYLNMTEKNTWMIENPLINPIDLHILGSLSGNNQSTLKYFDVVDPGKQDLRKGDWADGKPINQESSNAGDNTVLVDSSSLNQIDTLIDGNHQDVFSSKEAIEAILNFLDLPDVVVSSETAASDLSEQNILSIISDGNLHTLLSGNNPIPIKSEDGILFFINPADGEYNLNISSNINSNSTMYISISKKGEEVKNKIYQIKIKKDKPLDFKLNLSLNKSEAIKLIPK